MQGFELNVTDYLIKPFSFQRFVQAVDKAFENIKLISQYENTEVSNLSPAVEDNNTEDYVFVRNNNKMEKLIIDEILFIESMREYTSIQTQSRRFVVNYSLVKMEEMFPKSHFSRVHRSHIVALRHIDSINGNVITIGDKKVKIGASYRRDFFKKINIL